MRGIVRAHVARFVIKNIENNYYDICIIICNYKLYLIFTVCLYWPFFWLILVAGIAYSWVKKCRLRPILNTNFKKMADFCGFWRFLDVRPAFKSCL